MKDLDHIFVDCGHSSESKDRTENNSTEIIFEKQPWAETDNLEGKEDKADENNLEEETDSTVCSIRKLREINHLIEIIKLGVDQEEEENENL